MTARQSHEVGLALAHQQRTGCTPAAAAARYGVDVSSVRRAMKRAGTPTPRKAGRPAKTASLPNAAKAAD